MVIVTTPSVATFDSYVVLIATNVVPTIESLPSYRRYYPFDLIITDMHYPMKYGEKPVWDAGEHFIAKMQAKNIKTPIPLHLLSVQCTEHH